MSSKLEEGSISEKNGHHVFEFQDLSFSIKLKNKETKSLVDGISGRISSGEMLAGK